VAFPQCRRCTRCGTLNVPFVRLAFRASRALTLRKIHCPWVLTKGADSSCIEVQKKQNELFFARSRKMSIAAEAYTEYAAQGNANSDAEIAEKSLFPSEEP